MGEHTPTPWCLEPGAWISGKHAHRHAIVADCTHDGAISEPSQNANAAFIVKACNAHDDLVKALEVAKDWMMVDIEHGDEDQFEVDLALVDEALAKVQS